MDNCGKGISGASMGRGIERGTDNAGSPREKARGMAHQRSSIKIWTKEKTSVSGKQKTWMDAVAESNVAYKKLSESEHDSN